MSTGWYRERFLIQVSGQMLNLRVYLRPSGLFAIDHTKARVFESVGEARSVLEELSARWPALTFVLAGVVEINDGEEVS